MSSLILVDTNTYGVQADVDRLELVVRSHLNGRVRDFRLVARLGGLVILGFASSYYAKQLAQHAVMEAIDLPILANEIEVSSVVPADDESVY